MPEKSKSKALLSDTESSVSQNKPVEEWPLCDFLLSWFSDGFPLDKAQAYIALRRVPTMNDLDKQVCMGH